MAEDKFVKYATRIIAAIMIPGMALISYGAGIMGYEIIARSTFRPTGVSVRDLNEDGIEDLIVKTECGAAFSFIGRKDRSYVLSDDYLDAERDSIRTRANLIRVRSRRVCESEGEGK